MKLFHIEIIVRVAMFSCELLSLMLRGEREEKFICQVNQ